MAVGWKIPLNQIVIVAYPPRKYLHVPNNNGVKGHPPGEVLTAEAASGEFYSPLENRGVEMWVQRIIKV